MRILALETTERIGGIAALDGDKLLADLDLNPNQRAAQSLAPGLNKLLQRVGWQPADVDLVAVSAGPGSFTGLRIGITVAKTFAYAVGAEVLAVDTLEAIAAGAAEKGTRFNLCEAPSGPFRQIKPGPFFGPESRPVESLSVAIDAQRGDVVAESFQRGDDGWFVSTAGPALIDADAWLASLAPGTAVSGPVLRKLSDRLPSHLTVLAPQYWPPKAAAVARLARRLHAAGHRDDLWGLVPRYSRRSAAEEKAEEKWNHNPIDVFRGCG